MKEVVIVTVRKLLIGAAALSVAALVPAALAAERPDDRAGPIGVGGVAQTETATFDSVGTADTVEARIKAGLDARGNEIAATRPDDRAERFSPGMAAAAPTRPDDRAERPTSGPTQPVAAEPTAGTGVEWSDRLVVAVLTALAAAVAVAVAYGIVHRRGGGTGTTGTPGRPATTH